MRCVWAPQVPSRNPTPQSLLLGVQGPQVHSAHSLPGPPFFILSATPGNRAQDSPFLWSGLTWPPAPFQSPAPAASPFFLATAEVSASKARRARRRKLRRCILRGEHGSQESPPGAAGVDHPPNFAPVPRPGPKGRAATAADLGGLAARRQPGRTAGGISPGASWSPGRSSDPLPASGPQMGSGWGAQSRRAPSGAPHAHSLAARARGFAPSRAGLSRSGRGPFCLQNRSEPVTWAPAPSPLPRKDLPRPLPSSPRRPRPQRPRLPSLPAPLPPSFRRSPHTLASPGLCPRLSDTRLSWAPPSSDPGLSRPRASVWSPHPIPHAPIWRSIGPSPGLLSPFPPGRPFPSTATEP